MHYTWYRSKVFGISKHGNERNELGYIALFHAFDRSDIIIDYANINDGNKVTMASVQTIAVQ